jgi:hypothetical protein
MNFNIYRVYNLLFSIIYEAFAYANLASIRRVSVGDYTNT